jgi:predicted P-loop ATPase
LEKVDPQLKFSVSSKKEVWSLLVAFYQNGFFFSVKNKEKYFTEKYNGLIETS